MIHRLRGTLRTTLPGTLRGSHATLQQLLFASSGGISSLVSDTFNDTDGVLLENHTPDIDSFGGGWSSTFSLYSTPEDIQINNNRVQTPGATGTKVGASVIDSRSANVIISGDIVTINQNSLGNNGIIFRYTNANNYWLLDGLNGGAWRLIEVTGGSSNTRDTGGSCVHNTAYSLIITLSGNSISAVIVDEVTLSYTSASHNNATIHGISQTQANPGKSTYHDNFLVIPN